jgi:hypothetical protein
VTLVAALGKAVLLSAVYVAVILIPTRRAPQAESRSSSAAMSKAVLVAVILIPTRLVPSADTATSV